MKIADIRNNTDQQLTLTLLDLKKEAFNLRFQKVSGQLTNSSRINQVRKLIAKILTILNERKLLASGVTNA